MSESYKDRMIKEYRETKERYEKLHRMIVKYEAGRLAFVPDCSLELLKRQAKAMGEYLYILEIRAEIEEVTLVDESPTMRHGHWMKDLTGAEYCSECNQYPYDDGEYRIANWNSNYCPICGAKMDLSQGEREEDVSN